MADGSLGEPLGRRHAVVLYSAQVSYGTAVTPATACGVWNVNHSLRSSNISLRGPGSPNFVARKGGSTYTEWSMRTEALQTGAKTLLTKLARSSGVLPLITLGFGYSDDQGTPNRDADQIQDCKIGNWSVGLDVSSGHAPLTAELSGVGGLVTALTSLAPATLTSTPWMSYEGAFTKGGSAYQLRSFTAQGNHNLSRDHVIPGSTPSTFVRGHSYLTEHDETITGTLTRYAKSGVSVQASTLSQFALQLVLTGLDSGTPAITFAFATVDFDTERKEEDANGIFYSVDYEAKTLTVS